jgi:hypothetical protein
MVKTPKKLPTLKTFEAILLDGVRKGQIPGRSQAARDWFRKRAKDFTGLQPSTLMTENKDRFRTRPQFGDMYMFYYDPKLKKKLPYYDTFPLIFKLEEYPDRFLGINLHYLHPTLRAKLMDALYSTATNRLFNEKTKLEISYAILKQAAKFRFFKPCIKMYLKSHVRSKFMKVLSSEWDIALMLPVEQFQKASKHKVWADSKEAIKGK